MAVYVIAFATAYIINIKYKFVGVSARYESIDGLRGFLALGVFIHHTGIWYQYLHTGSWSAPKSNLYNQLGLTSVSFFFMITGFLFMQKLVHTKEAFNWKAFFISRFFRLVPMYVTHVVLLTSIAFIITGWKLQVSIFKLIVSIGHWLAFTIINTPKINGVPFTSWINAGVVWSLPYEWLFYFSLPLISLFILKKKPSVFYLLISAFFIIGFSYFHGMAIQYILSFVAGGITPVLVKYNTKKFKGQALLSGLLVFACFYGMLKFRTPETPICKLLATIVFISIGMGNNLFGLLKNTTLKFLGEMCYSTYLLHGIILFSVIYFGVGMERVRHFTEWQYCLLMFLITPLVVLFSFVGYTLIEKPFMDVSKSIRAKNKLPGIVDASGLQGKKSLQHSNTL
jgi:peptidoglycan/LPS O-acetylase OafA/YrhL